MLQEFKNHPVYPIVLETKEHYVKIKVLIFTCSYVSSEPIGSREKLTDLNCIMLAFVNMMFNINAAMGSDYINILNLFSCYDSANSHSKSIGDNYNVVKELGSISPSTNYLSGNFKSDEDLDFLDFEDLNSYRRNKILRQNKVQFLQKRKLLNEEFKNNGTVFSKISQDLINEKSAYWENHFDGVTLSSKQGVFRAVEFARI